MSVNPKNSFISFINFSHNIFCQFVMLLSLSLLNRFWKCLHNSKVISDGIYRYEYLWKFCALHKRGSRVYSKV